MRLSLNRGSESQRILSSPRPNWSKLRRACDVMLWWSIGRKSCIRTTCNLRLWVAKHLNQRRLESYRGTALAGFKPVTICFRDCFKMPRKLRVIRGVRLKKNRPGFRDFSIAFQLFPSCLLPPICGLPIVFHLYPLALNLKPSLLLGCKAGSIVSGSPDVFLYLSPSPCLSHCGVFHHVCLTICLPPISFISLVICLP